MIYDSFNWKEVPLHGCYLDLLIAANISIGYPGEELDSSDNHDQELKGISKYQQPSWHLACWSIIPDSKLA
jgi:hypothetical protein